jgi:hypothetical protein
VGGHIPTSSIQLATENGTTCRENREHVHQQMGRRLYRADRHSWNTTDVICEGGSSLGVGEQVVKVETPRCGLPPEQREHEMIV